MCGPSDDSREWAFPPRVIVAAVTMTAAVAWFLMTQISEPPHVDTPAERIPQVHDGRSSGAAPAPNRR